MTPKREQKEWDTFHLGLGRENQKGQDRNCNQFSQCFKRPLQQTSKAAQTRTQAPPKQPAEHLCVKIERGSVKYTLGNSLNCRHLMEHLLEKDYTEEQMWDFVFQLLKNVDWALVKATQPCSMAFLFSKVPATSYVHILDTMLQISCFITLLVHHPGVFLGSQSESMRVA